MCQVHYDLKLNTSADRNPARFTGSNSFKGTISVIIYLYIKTHLLTGIKYLGITRQKDPHKYTGSGTYWILHLKKHGYDYTTEILKECTTNAEVKELGMYYSKLWNIVDSEEWANLKEESGYEIIDRPPRIRSLEHNLKISVAKKGIPCSDTARKSLARGRENRIYTPMSTESKEKLRNSKLGTTATPKTKEKLKLAKANQLASNNICYEIIAPDGNSYIFNRLEIKQYCELNYLTYASLLAKGKKGRKYKGHLAVKILVPLNSEY